MKLLFLFLLNIFVVDSKILQSDDSSCIDLSVNCNENVNLCNDSVYGFIMIQECAKTCGSCANQTNVTPSNFSHSCESYYNWLELGGPDGSVASSTPNEGQPHTFECLATDKYCVEISNDVFGTDEMKGTYFCNVRGCESFVNKIMTSGCKYAVPLGYSCERDLHGVNMTIGHGVVILTYKCISENITSTTANKYPSVTSTMTYKTDSSKINTMLAENTTTSSVDTTPTKTSATSTMLTKLNKTTISTSNPITTTIVTTHGTSSSNSNIFIQTPSTFFMILFLHKFII